MNRRQWLFGAGVGAGSGMAVQARALRLIRRRSDRRADRPSRWIFLSTNPRACCTCTSRMSRGPSTRSSISILTFPGRRNRRTVWNWRRDREYLGTPEECLRVMDRKNIRAMVNLTGGYGKGLAEAVSKYDRAHPGRFLHFH